MILRPEPRRHRIIRRIRVHHTEVLVLERKPVVRVYLVGESVVRHLQVQHNALVVLFCLFLCVVRFDFGVPDGFDVDLVSNFAEGGGDPTPGLARQPIACFLIPRHPAVSLVLP